MLYQEKCLVLDAFKCVPLWYADLGYNNRVECSVNKFTYDTVLGGIVNIEEDQNIIQEEVNVLKIAIIK